MKKILYLIFCAIIIGCSNPYITNFISVNEEMLNGSYKFPIEQISKNEIPKIYSTDDIYAAEEALLENGYILIGSAKFKSTYIDKEKAIKAAQKKGAAIVVVKNRHIATITETIPFSVRQPDQRTVIREAKYHSDGKSSLKEQTITIEGEYQTQYFQSTKDYYDYQATFWAKLKTPKLGIYLTDLDDEIKKKYETNRGVIVKIVIKDTPAYYSDILKGDIFFYFNDERINNRKHFFKMLAENKGKEITLKGYRNNKEIIKQIKLND
ncbi:MAG TPA: PDZ domain-containing protein [bacterium]|nr:PDZ domain-containing protein [bacterium]